ncbi:hypothetical protein MMC21_003094 [Puttea exsequens]|nr:hypothetical protein [Puttea exsequens]
MANNNGTVFTTSIAPGAAAPSAAASSSAIVVDTTTGTSVSTFSQPTSEVIPSTTAGSTSEPSVVEVTQAAPTTTHVITSIASPSPGETDTAGNQNTEPSTILITSTQSPQPVPVPTSHSTSSKSSTSATGSAALATSSASPSSGSGLSAGGKIAVAVVVPVVAVALIVLAALFLWRRRKQRKDAEELRRKEVEEYGFNPNNDPTLPVVAGASTNGDESEMRETDGAGYRGWGTTSTARKPSTTLSSGNGPIGVARSTSNSDNGRYTNSPTDGTNKSSDVQSGDPLVGSPPNGRPITADSETIGALGAVPSNGNRHDIHRGPSNASSAYSGAHRSDTSGEGTIPGGAPNQQYYNDGLFYDEGMPQHGPYGDGSYGGGQPVIRDVQARRNTRIENPSVVPQQGNAGIAQNF